MPKIIRIPIRLLRDVIFRLTTEPNTESYKWYNKTSILGITTVLMILIARLISPLQWIKSFFRSKWIKKRQERSDFHSSHTEIYFISVTAAAFGAYIITMHNLLWFKPALLFVLFGKFIALWFLVESIGWVLYYSFFRVLIERRFTIYSLSEYLVSIPFVVFYQMILICLVFNVSLIRVFSVFFQFNIPAGLTIEDSLNADILISILRTGYLSLLIGYIVSYYPKMPIKSGRDFVCIGKSDAFEKYYKNAIRKIPASSLAVKNPSEPESAESIKEFYGDFEKFMNKNDPIFIISTPTPSHFKYITTLSNANKRFFVEKPIVSSETELSLIENDFQAFFKKGFFLQYYVLEKALPLTYIYNSFPEFEDYLLVGEKPFFPGDREKILFHLETLGKVKEIAIKILEGNERSNKGKILHWTESQETGGMMFDLGIHAFSLLRVVAGSGEVIFDETTALTDAHRKAEIEAPFREQLAPTYIKVSGRIILNKYRIISFSVEIGKHIKEENINRSLYIKADKGDLWLDFDEQDLLISGPSGPSSYETRIRSRDISDKYCSMFDLGIRQLDGEWLYRVDIPGPQIMALRDLIDLNKVLISHRSS